MSLRLCWTEGPARCGGWCTWSTKSLILNFSLLFNGLVRVEKLADWVDMVGLDWLESVGYLKLMAPVAHGIILLWVIEDISLGCS